MSLNPKDFYTQIAVPVLDILENLAAIPFTPFDACLMMGTAAQESSFGTFLDEDGGPALGIFQIVPSSLSDVISKLTAAEKVALASLATPAQPQYQVITNLVYAAAICRLYYRQRNMITPPASPADITLASIWAPYKQFWNTSAGAATLSQFTQNWKLTGITLPSPLTASAIIMPTGYMFGGRFP